MKFRILFVDDQQQILDGLRRVLHHKRDIWDMIFCSSAIEAIGVLDRSIVHVMVTDMRMPGFDGAQLCEEVMDCSPHTMRMILSGQSDNDQIFRAFGSTHRYLSKPCPPELLIESVTDAILLRDWLLGMRRDSASLEKHGFHGHLEEWRISANENQKESLR